jgi:hypothetical protein
MKKTATLFLLLFSSISLFSQIGNSTCANALQICFESPITYPATVGAGAAEVGPNYGCLNSRPNPGWFYFQVDTPGDHQLYITNSNNRDLDFIVYGPFAEENNWCDSLTAINTADCSYAGGATETANFTSVNSGDYYVLMITNFANLPTNVSVIQNAGTGTFSCNFVAPCLISGLTVTPSSCDTLTNLYNVSGQVWTFNPPSANVLNISVGEQSVQVNGPFTGQTNFTLSGLSSNGATENLIATFLANTTCTASLLFVAPEGCLPCTTTVTSNSPVCLGDTVRIMTELQGNGTFQWTGPSFFTSFAQNPEFVADSITAAGNYSVNITGDNCASTRNIDIEILNTPAAQITTVENEVCEGEILFLSAADVPFGSFEWVGPNGFTANSRNTIVNNATPAATGDYIISLSVNGCIGEPDTISATIFPSPVITITGPSQVDPSENTSVFEASGADGLIYFWNFLGNSSLISNVLYSVDKDTAIVFWDGGEGSLSAQVVAIDPNGCYSESVLLDILVEIPTGISDSQSFSNLKLFPNPAQDRVKFYIPSGDMEFRCIDLSGRTVMFKSALPVGYHEEDFSTMEAGCYFIELSNQKRKYSAKLIISRP